MAVEPYLASWTRGTPGTIVVTDPEYGAIGDGVHDDTAAILAAIQAAGSQGTVLFPPGTYNYSTLTLDQPGQRWAGAGRSLTTLACNSPTLNGIILASDDLSMEGLLFAVATGTSKASGNLLGMYNNSGGASSANHFRGRALGFTGTTGSQPFQGWGSSDVWFEDISLSGSLGATGLSFYACSQSGVVRVVAIPGLTFADGRPFLVNCNDCTDMTIDTVLAPGVQVSATMVQGTGLVGMESTTRGLVRALITSGMSAAGGAGTVDGVVVDNSGSGTPTHILVKDCVVDGVTGSGIDVYNADDVIVQGNCCSNCGDDGIEAFTSSHVQILGNKAVSNGNHGVHLAGATQVVCADNEIRLNQSNGIAGNAQGGTALADIAVHDNQCLDNNQAGHATSTPYEACGISMQSGGTNISLHDNICRNEAGATQLYGIGMFNSGWVQVQIHDNDCVSNAQEDLYLDWAYTAQTVTVARNQGFNPLGSRTPAASPYVSGTVYQNGDATDWTIYQPAYATASGTAGSVAVAMGPSNTPGTLYTHYIGGGTTSGSPDTIPPLRVPSGWYFSFTTTGTTLLAATIQAE